MNRDQQEDEIRKRFGEAMAKSIDQTSMAAMSDKRFGDIREGATIRFNVTDRDPNKPDVAYRSERLWVQVDDSKWVESGYLVDIIGIARAEHLVKKSKWKSFTDNLWKLARL